MLSADKEAVFRSRVSSCLDKLKLILDRGKGSELVLAEDVPHEYADKYEVVDRLVNSAVTSQLTVLFLMGLSEGDLIKAWGWSQAGSSVSLVHSIDWRCRFVTEAKREEEDPTRVQTSIAGINFGSVLSSKRITTITEYFYVLEASFTISLVRAVAGDDRIIIQSRASRLDIVLPKKDIKFPERTVKQSDVNVTWLLHQLNDTKEGLGGLRSCFRINRAHPKCHTPSRNEDVSAATAFFSKLMAWNQSVHRYFTGSHFNTQLEYSREAVHPGVRNIDASGIFVPVAPLLAKRMARGAVHHQALMELWEDEVDVQDAVVSLDVCSNVQPSGETEARMYAEHRRSLAERCEEVSQFASNERDGSRQEHAMISGLELRLTLLVLHSTEILRLANVGVQYVESMLRRQLVSAVGKELHASDFNSYMQFHQRKLFREAFQPKPFNISVRRSPDHSPEGSIRIDLETQAMHSIMRTSAMMTVEPVFTQCHSLRSGEATPMRFAIGAATNVTFGGERHLHGYLGHSFGGADAAGLASAPTLKLVAETRQFSSFILMVGRIASESVFEPKYAVIVNNKDEVSIPLDLELIPTQKEFRAAVQSMSPEQQRFAQAFRSMQLESTLFGVLVVQIKPQLERVLNLCPDSLTKEIRLTQDLMELFLKYNIPSDLLSFQNLNEQVKGGGVDSAVRLNEVRDHVEHIQSMISEAKQAKQAEREAAELFWQARREAAQKAALINSLSVSRKCVEEEEVDALDGGMCCYGGGYDEDDDDGCGPLAGGMSVGRGGLQHNDDCGGGSGGEPPVRSVPEQDLNGQSISSPPKGAATSLDFTSYPARLDDSLSKLDPDAAIRPTIIHPGSSWTKTSQESLLAKRTTRKLGDSEQVTERQAAFDLLDALTRSGSLQVDCASLHVVMAATHCFDESLMDTVVCGNVNPIERVERAMVVMGSVIHGLPPSALVSDEQRARLQHIGSEVL